MKMELGLTATETEPVTVRIPSKAKLGLNRTLGKTCFAESCGSNHDEMRARLQGPSASRIRLFSPAISTVIFHLSGQMSLGRDGLGRGKPCSTSFVISFPVY